jgi:23S rRNA pseudouridine2605 synthase
MLDARINTLLLSVKNHGANFLSGYGRMWYMEGMKQKVAMTLDRVLSRFGMTSRTVASDWIRAGRIKVNGRIVRNPGAWVQPGRDALHLDGKRMKQARKVYLLFYKPKGVITSHGDPDARDTVYDYLEGSVPWVVPVGRLDRDSSGLLLFTNDTDFADFISNPESGIAKTYLVKINGMISDETIAQLLSGVKLKRGDWARPQSVRRREDRGKYSRLEIVLVEGKNREVRRMMEAVGFTVLKLVRTSIGPLTLQGLEIGKYRMLTRAEVSSLRGSHER